MIGKHKVGDLVHIPQAVELIDCPDTPLDDPQMTIPLRVVQTKQPAVGIITRVTPTVGYVRVYCDGDHWSIKDDKVYTITAVYDT